MDKKQKKHDIFAKAYASNGNGAEAARLAGYKHGAVIASRLLKKPEIQSAIEHIRAQTIQLSASDNVAKARKLRSKDHWQAELLRHSDEATIAEHTRIMELFGKTEGFFSPDTNSPVINILNLTTEQLSERAKRLIDSLSAIKLPPTPSGNLSSDIVIDTTASDAEKDPKVT